MTDPEDIDAMGDDVLARSQELLERAIDWSPFRKAEVPVSVQPRSSNRKLAPQRVVDVNGRTRCEPIGPYVSSTYVAIESTCPASCRGGGCYAQAGMAVSRLDRLVQRRGWSGEATIDAEVKAIDQMFVRGVPQDGARGGRDLRLHVSGDAYNERGARMLAGAATRWQARGGGAVWSFTHLWRRVPRDAWGPISVLASVETRRDAMEAVERGYAPALTVTHHEGDHAIPLDGTKIVPCPAQTRDRTCAECRLCLDADLNKRRLGVAFAIHGKEADRARRRLRTIQRARRT